MLSKKSFLIFMSFVEDYQFWYAVNTRKDNTFSVNLISVTKQKRSTTPKNEVVEIFDASWSPMLYI